MDGREITRRVASRAASVTGVSAQEIVAELGVVQIDDDGGWWFASHLVSAQVREAVEQAILELRVAYPVIEPEI